MQFQRCIKHSQFSSCDIRGAGGLRVLRRQICSVARFAKLLITGSMITRRLITSIVINVEIGISRNTPQTVHPCDMLPRRETQSRYPGLRSILLIARMRISFVQELLIRQGTPAPAVCPQSDGIGISETFEMNAAS